MHRRCTSARHIISIIIARRSWTISSYGHHPWSARCPREHQLTGLVTWISPKGHSVPGLPPSPPPGSLPPRVCGLFPSQRPAAFPHSRLSLHPSCSLFSFLQRSPFLSLSWYCSRISTCKYKQVRVLILLFLYTQADASSALTLLSSRNNLSRVFHITVLLRLPLASEQKPKSSPSCSAQSLLCLGLSSRLRSHHSSRLFSSRTHRHLSSDQNALLPESLILIKM